MSVSLSRTGGIDAPDFSQSNIQSLETHPCMPREIEQAIGVNFTIIKGWVLDKFKASLCFDQNKQLLAIIQKNNGEWFYFKKTVTPFETIVGIPQDLEPTKLSAFLQDTYIRLVNIGNRHKLYIHQRGRGGVLSLANAMQLSNGRLAEVIINHLSKNSIITSVGVHSVNHQFLTRQHPTLTRKIVLTLNERPGFCQLFHAFFAGLGLIDSPYEKNIDEGKLKDQLIKVVCDDPREKDEIILAYNQAKNVELYIARDLNDICMQLKDTHNTTICKVGNTLGKGTKIAIGLAALFRQLFPLNQPDAPKP